MEQKITLSQEEKSMETSTSRRSFLRKGLVVGGAGTIGAGLLAVGCRPSPRQVVAVSPRET